MSMTTQEALQHNQGVACLTSAMQPNELAVQPALERAMAVTESSVAGLFKEVMELNARLEASERRTREISAMNDVQARADADEISALRTQIAVLNETIQKQFSEAQEMREALAKLQQNYMKLREHCEKIAFHSEEMNQLIDGRIPNGNHLLPILNLAAELRPLLKSCPDLALAHLCGW